MKRIIFIVIVLVFYNSSDAQSVIGKWKTFNRHTRAVRSIIEIFEKGGS